MITSFAFQRSNKSLVPTDMVDEKDGKFYSKEDGEELPDPEALRRDYRSYILDYLPERALFYVRCELDLMEEATIPQVPPGPYQEHLLAEAAALAAA